MSRYRKVKTRMWGDEKFRQLSAPKPNAQTLWQYLLTGPYTTATIPGLINAGAGTLAEGLGWPLAATRRCLTEITDLGMAEYDEATRVIWLPRALLHNEPQGVNTVTSWYDTIKEIPDSYLKDKAIEHLLDYLRGRGEGWETAWHEPSQKASAKASRTPSGMPSPMPSGMPSPMPSGMPSPMPSGMTSRIQNTGAGAGAGAGAGRVRDTRETRLALIGHPGFDAFWRAYPKRVAKDAALKAWRKCGCEGKADEILTGLHRGMAYLTREGGQFIPNPATWLNAGRWKDEPPIVMDPLTASNMQAAHDFVRDAEQGR